jgi:hypothetical protein
MTNTARRPQTLDMGLGDYIDGYLEQNSRIGVAPEATAERDPPSYLFDGYFEDTCPNLMRDVGRGFTRKFSGGGSGGERSNLVLAAPYFDAFSYYTYQLVVGPAFSGANPHFHHTTWNALVTGRKRWWIWPPGASFYSTRHPFYWYWEESDRHARDDQAFQCMQEAGDVFFLPDEWGHAVVNVNDAVAVAESTFFGYDSFSGFPMEV